MDTLTLCATTRLAQTLRLAPVDGAAAVWATPRTATVGQWLGELGEELLLAGEVLPAVLDGFAERLLWEKVIAASLDPAATPLFDIEGMAAAAQEAHALLGQWQLDPPRHAFLSEEARLFVDWRERFVRHCQRAGWSDAVSLQAVLVERLASGAGALPRRLVFAGFDRFTPLERRLQAVCEARGCVIEFAPFPAVDRESPVAHEFSDGAAECAAAAAWARQRLSEQPGRRIGIVVPDLEARRSQLCEWLDEALHPQSLDPAHAAQPRVYNLSLGTPLAQVPLVARALDLLGLCVGRGKLDPSLIGRLLLADGWSADQREADSRARCEARLRREIGGGVSLGQWLRLMQRGGDCPQTTATLEALVVAQAATGRKPAACAEWGNRFRAWLDLAGWPGERPLDSDEFQAVQAFRLELERLGRLDAVLGPVAAGEALRRLRQALGQRLFQPQTRGTPAVQVLGVLESAGLHFDALWLMGMNDDLWPPAPAPNPLLPAEFQRQAGLPRASAEVELAFARTVQARLLTAAGEVRLSWAQRDGNRERRRSPLLPALSPVPSDWPVLQPLRARLAAAGDAAQDLLDDAQAPPVPADQMLHGGAALLQAQAVCPAWAFYTYRLGARALEEAVDGLDAADRGTLVHAVLEAFWRALGDSAALAALDAAGQAAAVATAVEAALVRFESARHQPLPAGFRRLEAARLARLLDRWLVVERQRSVPFAIHACEQEVTLDLGRAADRATENGGGSARIRLQTRVDRIDRLDGGGLVIIDYKTGSRLDLGGWTGDRPAAPQLPLYAAFAVAANGDEETAVATVFARVRPEAPAFAGLAAEAGWLPGVQGLGDARQKLFDPARFADWAAVVQHWHERLAALAEEIADGFAGVMIADEAALAYCPVKPLLRLPEWRRQLAAALAEGAAAAGSALPAGGRASPANGETEQGA